MLTANETMVLEKIGLMGVFLVKNTFTRMHCEFLLLTLFGSLLGGKNRTLAFQKPTNAG